MLSPTLRLSVLLLLLSVGLASCEKDPDSRSICIAPVSCDWDEGIPGGTAEEILVNWQNKWTGLGSVPDSFFINRYALEDLAIAHCGFRAYAGLVEAGDVTTMGLIIVPIDTSKSDLTTGEKRILFTDVSNPDDPAIDSIIYLPLSTAQTYTENWRKYNGVCLESDSLGNTVCPVDTTTTRIPPNGNYGEGITQFIPMGLAFAAKEVFCTLTGDGNYSNYVIYNCMYDLPENIGVEDSSVENGGYRYDLYIRGIEFSESGESTLIDIAQSAENLSEAIDITTPCPLDCGDSQVLQGGSN